MCGIAGIMTAGSKSPDAELLEKMATAMRHRGPDGRGSYMHHNVGMIHLRLAIIDLATGGHPLREPGGAALIGNGEIYNYVELRRDSQLRDAEFTTNSDFEPALHLYRRLGANFTQHLRGMYAIAVHDPRDGKLILARDPYGIKPLYYVEKPGFFAFASEAQALALTDNTQLPSEPAAYRELMSLPYVTGARSGYPGVHRVLPGERIIVEDGRIIARYRDAALPEGPPEAMDQAEAEARLDSALAESVSLHQRSDVPYGLFLSGGIDSSALLAMMARLNSRPVRTFTTGFRSVEVKDERKLARKLASELGAEHTEVEFDESDFWGLLPKVAGVLDDPTADFAALPTYKLAAVASQSVKVVLTGEGGDEFFAGYGRYRRAARPWWRAGALMARLKGSAHMGNFKAAAPQNDAGGWTRLQAAQAADIADWLPNDLLTKLDRCLMAHSLEGRVPFVDPVLSPFAFRLPDKLKFQGRLGKHILRKWLAKHLPSAQPFSRKRGFRVPVHEWMAREADRIAPLVARQSGIRELCDPAAVRDLFVAARPETEIERWRLLFFACWHQRHICGVRDAGNTFQHLAAL
jgi:asparagine synthase (glutamine-hydrolysing)